MTPVKGKFDLQRGHDPGLRTVASEADGPAEGLTASLAVRVKASANPSDYVLSGGSGHTETHSLIFSLLCGMFWGLSLGLICLRVISLSLEIIFRFAKIFLVEKRVLPRIKEFSFF